MTEFQYKDYKFLIVKPSFSSYSYMNSTFNYKVTFEGTLVKWLNNPGDHMLKCSVCSSKEILVVFSHKYKKLEDALVGKKDTSTAFNPCKFCPNNRNYCMEHFVVDSGCCCDCYSRNSCDK